MNMVEREGSFTESDVKELSGFHDSKIFSSGWKSTMLSNRTSESDLVVLDCFLKEIITRILHTCNVHYL